MWVLLPPGNMLLLGPRAWSNSFWECTQSNESDPNCRQAPRCRWTLAPITPKQFLLSFLLVYRKARTSVDSVCRRYLRGGLAERAFYLQLVNAALPPLLRLAAPGRLANRFIFASFVRTQVSLVKRPAVVLRSPTDDPAKPETAIRPQLHKSDSPAAAYVVWPQD